MSDRVRFYPFILSVFLFLFLLTASAGSVLAASRLGRDLPTSAEESDVTLSETPDAGESYLRRFVFVGDSTTCHLIDRGVLPSGTDTAQVWVPRNGTMMLTPAVTELKIVHPASGRELTVAEAAAIDRPAYLVLTVGLNGAHTFTEELYKHSYGKLIDAVRSASPETRILVQSVFPVAKNETAWTSVTPAELNRRIDRLNSWAKELCETYGGKVRYLDTQSVLRDPDGFLRSAYEAGDGVHLTAEGYRAILGYIRTHAWKD